MDPQSNPLPPVTPEVTANPNNMPAKKPKLTQKQMMMYGGVGLIGLIICIVITIALLANRGGNNGNNNGGNNSDGGAEPTATETPTPTPTVTVKKVAYIKDENIWIVNEDATGKTQITTDGDGSSVRYRAMDWKNSTTLSYGRCDADGCEIINEVIATTTTSVALTLPPTTQDVDAIEWSNNENHLAYIFTKADSSREASLLSGGTTTSLKMYAPPLGRGGAELDGISVQFNDNDNRILALNTITDISFGQNTINVFDLTGTTLLTMDGFSPTFDGNDAFYYIDDSASNIKRKVITGADTIVTTLPDGGNDISASPDYNFISYWTFADSSEPAIAFFDVASSHVPIADGYAAPQWLDNTFLVAYAAELDDFAIPYAKSTGLVRINRTTGANINLDGGEIYTFEVE